VTVTLNWVPAVGVDVEGTTVKWCRALAATVIEELATLVAVHVLQFMVTVYV
jgi:hypothetical protein